MEATALPLVDCEIDQNPSTRKFVEALIEEEVAVSGGHEKLLQEYMSKVGGSSPDPKVGKAPQPLKALDLLRYDLTSTPTATNASERAKAACCALEYERMKQTNLLLISQLGNTAWSTHAENLGQEIKKARMDVEKTTNSISHLDTERQQSQIAAAKELSILNEKWGSLAFSAAMLRTILRDE